MIIIYSSTISLLKYLRKKIFLIIFLVLPLSFLFAPFLSWAFGEVLGDDVQELILKVFAFSMIGIIMISMYLFFKIRDEIIELNHKGNLSAMQKQVLFYQEKHLHYHSSFSGISALILTICGLLFSAYSDVFFQHGKFIDSINKGLNDNNTSFNLDDIQIKSSDTVDLVFMIDVSGSINGTEIKAEPGWIERASYKITKYPNMRNEDRLENDILNLDTAKPSDLIKLKICDLLVSSRDSLIKNNKNYKVTLIDFGKTANIIQQQSLTDNNEFEKMINQILELRCSRNLVSRSDFAASFRKVKQFVNLDGQKDIYSRPNTVITIFSDYIDDSKTKNIQELENEITQMANRSTFFNLFYLEPKDQGKNSGKNLIPLYTRYPDQINLQRLSDEIKLYCAKTKSRKQVEIIMSHPQYAGKTFITSNKANQGLVVKLISTDENEWQQFTLNGKPVRPGIPDTIQANSSPIVFGYTGYTTNQLARTFVEFEFLSSKEKVISQIVYKKGLKMFVSKLFFALGVLLLMLSVVYTAYLFRKKEINMIYSDESLPALKILSTPTS